ncbi:hypothetical protein [Azospirillum largimobile]
MEFRSMGSGPCWRRYRRSRFGLQQGGAPFGLQKRGKNAAVPSFPQALPIRVPRQ